MYGANTVTKTRHKFIQAAVMLEEPDVPEWQKVAIGAALLRLVFKNHIKQFIILDVGQRRTAITVPRHDLRRIQR